jgi:radical SAM superfamily enzyme YgiQ (UPF0313 family)
MLHHKVKRYGNGEIVKRIYLIAPRHPDNFWMMQGTVEAFRTKSLMPNAALPTLMALTPKELSADATIEYMLCDENVSGIDLNLSCDLVAITGSTLHSKRIRELCRAFRRRGIPIALGGTYASIHTDQCREFADHLFIGEAEYTWPHFLRQWIRGCARSEYHQQGYVDLTDSPPPDWSLHNPRDYVQFNVQTSRGCPHNCDFCDVILYLGRKYRTKSIEQVLNEVAAAHALGTHTVFFSDDNFMGSKSFTRKLLMALIQWNTSQARPITFSTQITVEVADDEELLQMFADANFIILFIGVETVRRKSLEEVHKAQVLRYDIYERIRRISRFGILPFIGLIVGFDHDDETVFEDLQHFIDATFSPIAGIGLLNAPKNTPLYNRLKQEGRLKRDDFSGEWQFETNIIPKQMEEKVLLRKYKHFFKSLYDPPAFSVRYEKWIRHIDYITDLYIHKKFSLKEFSKGILIFLFFILRVSSEFKAVFLKCLKMTWKHNPRLVEKNFVGLIQYYHFYQFTRKFKDS